MDSKDENKFENLRTLTYNINDKLIAHIEVDKLAYEIIDRVTDRVSKLEIDNQFKDTEIKIMKEAMLKLNEEIINIKHGKNGIDSLHNRLVNLENQHP